MNSRISINQNVCNGKPVITGTRVLVSNILADLAEGQSFDDIIVNYSNITHEDIKAALQFGSELVQFETVEIKTAS